MNRRPSVVAVLMALLALQALLFTPLSYASPAHGRAAPASHCTHHSGGGHQCPCCPDGALMVAGCMSLCTAFSGALALTPIHRQSLPSAASPFAAPFASSQTYAPPNPPPIR